MRAIVLCMALIAVVPVDCMAAGPAAVRTIPAPVRLPAVAPTAASAPPLRMPATPVFFQPIVARDFETIEPVPAVELDLDLPKGPRTTVGGWIAVGYHGGAVGP